MLIILILLINIIFSQKNLTLLIEDLSKEFERSELESKLPCIFYKTCKTCTENNNCIWIDRSGTLSVKGIAPSNNTGLKFSYNDYFFCFNGDFFGGLWDGYKYEILLNDTFLNNSQSQSMITASWTFFDYINFCDVGFTFPLIIGIGIGILAALILTVIIFIGIILGIIILINKIKEKLTNDGPVIDKKKDKEIDDLDI